jgi:hypothetical protein
MCARHSLIAQSSASVSVPFVGCKSDGQIGPMEAPKGNPKSVPVSSQSAQQLAYYESAQGVGVLGPRGWYCFGTYGSGGVTLFVSPQPIDTPRFLSRSWAGFAGAAIELSHSYGGTSGRFEVAEVIARVFPVYKSFVTGVIEGFGQPASSYPFGPYPQDKLAYKSDRIVEYQTPAHADGLGIQSWLWLKKNDSPIDGVAMLIGKTPDLVLLSVRLPSGLHGLARAIIGQLERDAPRFDQ